MNLDSGRRSALQRMNNRSRVSISRTSDCIHPPADNATGKDIAPNTRSFGRNYHNVNLVTFPASHGEITVSTLYYHCVGRLLNMVFAIVIFQNTRCFGTTRRLNRNRINMASRNGRATAYETYAKNARANHSAEITHDLSCPPRLFCQKHCLKIPLLLQRNIWAAPMWNNWPRKSSITPSGVISLTISSSSRYCFSLSATPFRITLRAFG